MKKKKSIVLALVAMVALAIFCAIVIAPGFSKQGNAYITDYSVSEDGTEMTITIGLFTSMGYVREVSVHQQHGGKLYLDCYSAFGGLNGSWGAKDTYTIPLEEDTEIIALYRAANCYETVLEKDANGVWQHAEVKQSPNC